MSTRRSYSRFTYVHKATFVLTFGFSLLVCFLLFGFHIDAFLVSALVATGVFVVLPPEEDPSQRMDHWHDQPGDEDFPIPRGMDSWDLAEAIFMLRTRAPFIKLQPRDLGLLQDMLDDAKWIHERYHLLTDFPEHKATIELIVKNYIPEVARSHYKVASRQLTRRERKLLNDLTRTDLVYLIDDVRRVREAISQGSLNTLEAHAEAIRRSLEARTKLPPDVL